MNVAWARMLAVSVVVVGMSAVLPGGALAASSVDLLTQANVRVVGAAEVDDSGAAVAGAGDVNGDGRADVIIASPLAHNNGRSASGSTYVIYGQATTTTIDLASLTMTQGFRIDGAAANDQVGRAVAGAGDVNGDGYADLIIGAVLAHNNGRSASGSSYVIYGRPNPTNIDLATLTTTQGYRIDGAAANDESGISVAPAGDANGDGRPDLIIGAFGADNNGRGASGSSYVIYSRPDATNIDLASLTAAQGYRIDGAAADDQSGLSVARAGDVNGDGRADVIVGAVTADNNGRSASGSSYVIYGQPNPTNVDLASLTTGQGFRIDGAAASDQSGRSVAGAGDTNGDGRADVIIGANLAGNNGRTQSGSSYVIYGQPNATNIDLATLTTAQGYRIDGAAANDESGVSVAGAGDANGDGRADVIVGAPLVDNNSRTDSGSSYVIYGQANAPTIDLATLTTAQGYRIDGADTGDHSGGSVAGAGDTDGDGRPDVIIGAPGADPGRSGAGASYVVFGTANRPPVADDDGYQVVGAPTLSVAAPGVLGNDSDPDGDTLSAHLATGPAHAASFALNADGSFTYVPNDGFEGTDSFTYRANDGSADSNVATVTITVDTDTTPPDTSITAGPIWLALSNTTRFSFASSEPGSSFECRLDDGTFQPCTNPNTYTGVGLGFHSFEVRAVDAAGNVDPTPARLCWLSLGLPLG